MSLPLLDDRTPSVGRYRRSKVPPAWSCTASTGPREDDNVLVVYRLAVARLGIEDLTREVAACYGSKEAARWQRARVREFVTNLREQLRLHLAATELIIHAEEGTADDRLQVIPTVPSGDAQETARLEQEIAERVEAISERAWITWSEGLRLTMATLQDLDADPCA